MKQPKSEHQMEDAALLSEVLSSSYFMVRRLAQQHSLNQVCMFLMVYWIVHRADES